MIHYEQLKSLRRFYSQLNVLMLACYYYYGKRLPYIVIDVPLLVIDT